MKAAIGLELEPFNIPNYVRTKKVDVVEGLISDAAIPLRDLDTATLHELCEQFKKDIFKKANKSMLGRIGNE